MTTQPTPIRKAINNIMEWHDFDKKEQVVGLLVELMQEERVRIEEAYAAGSNPLVPGNTPNNYYIAKYGEIPSYEMLDEEAWKEIRRLIRNGPLMQGSLTQELKLVNVPNHIAKWQLRLTIHQFGLPQLQHFNVLNDFVKKAYGVSLVFDIYSNQEGKVDALELTIKQLI